MYPLPAIGFFRRSIHIHSDTPISLLLKKHSNTGSIAECKQIHSKLITSGALSQIHLTNTLLTFYSKNEHLHTARQLFDQMPHKNVVSWTSIISSYLHHGSSATAFHLFKQMLESNERPNEHTLSIVIRACTSYGFVALGKQVHGLAVRFGLERDEFAGSCLVGFYFKVVGNVVDASRVFEGMCRRDSVTWNVMISGYAEVGETDGVLGLFWEMQVVDGLKPNQFTFISLLKCCRLLRDVQHVHGLALKYGFEANSVVGNALVDSYGKCGDIRSGRQLFDSMEVKDNFVWSSVISGYVRNGSGEDAITLFKCMCRRDGAKLDQHALSSALGACVAIRDFKLGSQVHSLMIKNGLQRDCFVASVLLSLYADTNISDAEKLFRRIDDLDLVAWNSMMMGYAQWEEGSTSCCIGVFQELRRTTRLKPDGVTFIALLKSCHTVSDLVVGLQIHAVILKLSLIRETTVGNALISMYSSIGAVDDAYKTFDDILIKDEISWSSIIGNYQQNGFEQEALRLCREMLAKGVNLTSFSLPLCITACVELGAIDLGKQFHAYSLKYGFNNRDVYVGSSIIDMYAKCGNMADSLLTFEDMKNPNEVAFNALISGFAQHGKAIESIGVFKDMENMKLIPNGITFLSILSACNHAGLIEESLYFFNLMYRKYNIKPESEHYACLVDVFGRAGRLEEAYEIIEKNASVEAWKTLLSACRNYGNLEMAEKCAVNMMKLDPDAHASYVLLYNLYCEEGKWEEAISLRQKMIDIGVKKNPGSSTVFMDGVR